MAKASEDILRVLEKMREHELAVAEFYRACGQAWSSEQEFWIDMEQAEIRHAQRLEKMMAFVSEKPERFKWGRSLKVVSIQTSILGIQKDSERLKKRELPAYKAVFIARDIEQSIIESKYGEVIATDDVQFRALMNEVVSDTRFHLDRLNRKIREWSG